jgi:hypothetical protein
MGWHHKGGKSPARAVKTERENNLRIIKEIHKKEKNIDRNCRRIQNFAVSTPKQVMKYVHCMTVMACILCYCL